MVSNIIIAFFIVLICYAYTNHNREFNATASAIRQIWSGSCRLGCRNQYSGFSGLSGLERAPAQTCDCVCDSCPCALVDNVLKTCRPATDIYSKLIEFARLTDLFNYLEQVMRNEISGQRQARLININQLNSGGNINFFDQVKNELDKTKVPLPRSRSITFSRESDAKTSSKNPTSLALNLEVSEPVQTGSGQTMPVLDNCSRCSEKDVTCMGTCPREKKN